MYDAYMRLKKVWPQRFCPPGVYTIVAVSEGAGASMWGKLKSGIGWLSLDFCRRV